MSARGGPQVIPRPPGSRPGRPAPWAGLPAPRALALDELTRRVAERGPGRVIPGVVDPIGRDSAVLIALYEDDGQAHVVLTRRSGQLRSHRLEVSFPGGRSDPGDRSPWETAIREAHEEIALDPRLPRQVGELDRFVTVGSRSLVHPLVAVLPDPPADLRPEPAEVEHILHVQLAELLQDDVFREESWPIGDHFRPITFFDLHGDTIWGATGAMLRQLLCIALGVDDGPR